MENQRKRENYTAQQIVTIRAAVKQGRRALMQSDGHPRAFASAFIRAGGLQLPGGELDQQTGLRLESHIMLNVNGRAGGSDEEPRLRDLIRREVERAFGEAERLQSMTLPDLLGYRLTIDDRAPRSSECRRYLALDAFGLGAGVVPPHEIVVLPPCCDDVRWEPVYDNEGD